MLKMMSDRRRAQAQDLPVLMISTCGTSLLTNRASPDFKKALIGAANLSDTEVDQAFRDQVDALLREIRSGLDSAQIDDVRKASAELSGILTFYGGDLGRGRSDQHYILATDTYLGRVAGESLAEWLRPKVGGAIVCAIPKLNTRSVEDFREGAKALVKFFGDLEGSGSSGYRVVLNCIGGFKAFQAYTSALGLIYGHEQFYLFESEGSPLIRIPGLPIKLDLKGIVSEHFETFRKLAIGPPLPRSQVAAIPETLLYTSGDEVLLDACGELAWNAPGDTRKWDDAIRMAGDGLQVAGGIGAFIPAVGLVPGLMASAAGVVITWIGDLLNDQVPGAKPAPAAK